MNESTAPESLAALACEDCPAIIRTSRGRGLAGEVLVVAVMHEVNCPWMARVAPDGATMSSPDGVLIHSIEARPQLRSVQP